MKPMVSKASRFEIRGLALPPVDESHCRFVIIVQNKYIYLNNYNKYTHLSHRLSQYELRAVKMKQVEDVGSLTVVG